MTKNRFYILTVIAFAIGFATSYTALAERPQFTLTPEQAAINPNPFRNAPCASGNCVPVDAERSTDTMQRMQRAAPSLVPLDRALDSVIKKETKSYPKPGTPLATADDLAYAREAGWVSDIRTEQAYQLAARGRVLFAQNDAPHAFTLTPEQAAINPNPYRTANAQVTDAGGTGAPAKVPSLDASQDLSDQFAQVAALAFVGVTQGYWFLLVLVALAVLTWFLIRQFGDRFPWLHSVTGLIFVPTFFGVLFGVINALAAGMPISVAISKGLSIGLFSAMPLLASKLKAHEIEAAERAGQEAEEQHPADGMSAVAGAPHDWPPAAVAAPPMPAPQGAEAIAADMLAAQRAKKQG